MSNKVIADLPQPQQNSIQEQQEDMDDIGCDEVKCCVDDAPAVNKDTDAAPVALAGSHAVDQAPSADLLNQQSSFKLAWAALLLYSKVLAKRRRMQNSSVHETQTGMQILWLLCLTLFLNLNHQWQLSGSCL